MTLRKLVFPISLLTLLITLFIVNGKGPEISGQQSVITEPSGYWWVTAQEESSGSDKTIQYSYWWANPIGNQTAQATDKTVKPISTKEYWWVNSPSKGTVLVPYWWEHKAS